MRLRAVHAIHSEGVIFVAEKGIATRFAIDYVKHAFHQSIECLEDGWLLVRYTACNVVQLAKSLPLDPEIRTKIYPSR